MPVCHRETGATPRSRYRVWPRARISPRRPARLAVMDSRRVGRSGLEVSRLGLGTMTWGRDTDADAAASQLEAFIGAGGTLIDTANIYGDGDAESILGTLVPDVVSRSSVVLSTTTVGVGGGRGRLLAALDESLSRLATDHVDLWQVHGFDAAVPFEETCSALRTAVDSGRTRYVGVSGVNGWQLATLAGCLTAGYVGRYRTDQAARVVEAVATAAEGLGTSPLAVACAWVRDRSAVSSVVIGARDRAQLLGSLAAEEITLPAEIRSALDDVSAG